jgi:apolipoprotein N-acyltransferase
VTWIAESAILSYGWRRFLLLFIAGAVAATSAPPVFFLPALFLAMPILVWCLDGAERMRGWRKLLSPAFGIGFAFGLGYFATALHWLGAAFIQEGGIFLVLMPFAILGLAAILALFWALATAIAHAFFWSGGALRVVGLAGALAIAEYARGHLFSGFPFDLLGYALTANDEMMQLASIVGVYGLTFLAALSAMTIALIWPADERGLVPRLVPFFLAVAVIAAQVGYGNWRLNNTEVSQRTDMKVRLAQPMIVDHADWTAADPANVMDRLISLSESGTGLEGITHLVWPESVFPFFLEDYPDALARIARMLPPQTVLLTGAPRAPIADELAQDVENPGYNSILSINSDGEIVGSYDKSHLVPFGEYLPFDDFWQLFGIRQFVPGTNGWAAGDGRRLQQIPGTPPFLALVCYEAVFPNDIGDVTKAEFILNITNDAWFDGSIGPAQHAHLARIRSVETGLPMLRASNTGTTIVTDPLGRIVARLAEREVAAVDVVPHHRLAGQTLFTILGDWPFWATSALALLLGYWGARRERATRA